MRGSNFLYFIKTRLRFASPGALPREAQAALLRSTSPARAVPTSTSAHIGARGVNRSLHGAVYAEDP